MTAQTLEQWIDKNAPKWVQDAYVKQTREFIDRLESAERNIDAAERRIEVGERLLHKGDEVVAPHLEPGETKVLKVGEGQFPIPEEIKNDPDTVEILRVWKHGNGSCSHVSATYQLEGPSQWGQCLGEIARSVLDGAEQTENADPSNMIGYTAALTHGFLSNLGVAMTVLAVDKGGGGPGDSEPDDPDNLLN